MAIEIDTPFRRQLAKSQERFISDERFDDLRLNTNASGFLPKILQRRATSNRSIALWICFPLLMLMACSPSNPGGSSSPKRDANSSEASVDAGARLFIQCKACHTLGQDAGHAAGPNLFGIVGSEAGSKTGFNYSKSMQAADLIWTEENLDQFLNSPNGFIKGTSMTFSGMPDKNKRKELIDFLSSYRQN